jgi:hypothetical protein
MTFTMISETTSTFPHQSLELLPFCALRYLTTFRYLVNFFKFERSCGYPIPKPERDNTDPANCHPNFTYKLFMQNI